MTCSDPDTTVNRTELSMSITTHIHKYMHTHTHIWKEGNVLINDPLNIFYLW